MKKIILFSRDARTEKLFRNSWIKALNELNYEVFLANRGTINISIISGLRIFFRVLQFQKIVYGTSEICLYIPFLAKRDILVFTGLGRLLTNKGPIKNIVIFYLKIFYRGQKIICLNTEDKKYIESFLPCKPIKIEGYSFQEKEYKLIQIEPKQIPKFVYVGRIIKSKNIDFLIETFLELNLEYEFHLFGDFDFNSSDAISSDWLADKVEQSNGKIFYHGFRQDLFKHLDEFQAMISFSTREGLPFSMLDGIQAGCYLIINEAPGHNSFNKLEGVSFVERSSLTEFLNNFISSFDAYITFDRNKRLAVSNKIFGINKIIRDIKIMIQEH